MVATGLGLTTPDPKGFYTTEDGVVIPMGVSTKANIPYSSLLYNEYPFSLGYALDLTSFVAICVCALGCILHHCCLSLVLEVWMGMCPVGHFCSRANLCPSVCLFFSHTHTYTHALSLVSVSQTHACTHTCTLSGSLSGCVCRYNLYPHAITSSCNVRDCVFINNNSFKPIFPFPVLENGNFCPSKLLCYCCC